VPLPDFQQQFASNALRGGFGHDSRLLEAAHLLESLRNIAGAHGTKHMDGRLIPQMCGKKFCSFAAKVVE
jgi:hypothetical protein